MRYGETREFGSAGGTTVVVRTATADGRGANFGTEIYVENPSITPIGDPIFPPLPQEREITTHRTAFHAMGVPSMPSLDNSPTMHYVRADIRTPEEPPRPPFMGGPNYETTIRTEAAPVVGTDGVGGYASVHAERAPVQGRSGPVIGGGFDYSFSTHTVSGTRPGPDKERWESTVGLTVTDAPHGDSTVTLSININTFAEGTTLTINNTPYIPSSRPLELTQGSYTIVLRNGDKTSSVTLTVEEGGGILNRKLTGSFGLDDDGNDIKTIPLQIYGYIDPTPSNSISTTDGAGRSVTGGNPAESARGPDEQWSTTTATHNISTNFFGGYQWGLQNLGLANSHIRLIGGLSYGFTRTVVTNSSSTSRTETNNTDNHRLFAFGEVSTALTLTENFQLSASIYLQTLMYGTSDSDSFGDSILTGGMGFDWTLIRAGNFTAGIFGEIEASASNQTNASGANIASVRGGGGLAGNFDLSNKVSFFFRPGAFIEASNSDNAVNPTVQGSMPVGIQFKF